MAPLVTVAKRYAFPTILVALAVVWQLMILPGSFPRSHYDTIGVKPNSSTEEIIKAYERLALPWYSNKDIQIVTENIIEYLYGGKANAVYLMETFDCGMIHDKHGDFDCGAEIRKAVLLEGFDSLARDELREQAFLESLYTYPIDYTSKVLTVENFGSMLGDNGTWLIQLYFDGVESAPAILFLKDPGVEPFVHYGTINSSEFLSLMEQHKSHGEWLSLHTMILSWISDIIKDGDSKDLPYFRTRTPDLIPEESKPAWSEATQKFVFRGNRMLKERIRDFVIGVSDRVEDPRIGPILLLITALYLGGIWLRTKQSTQQNEQGWKIPNSFGTSWQTIFGWLWTLPVNSVESDMYEPTSIADVEPPDAYQAIETDSDSNMSSE